MTRMVQIIFFCLLLIPFQQLYGQEIDQIITDIIEAYIDETNEEQDYTILEENLIDLYQNPVSLNGDRHELERLFFLTTAQVNDILAYRKRYWGFMSVYELKTIASMDMRTIHYLKYFVTAASDKNYGDLKAGDAFRGRNKIMLKHEQILEKQSGYQDTGGNDHNKYLGNRHKLYLRYEHNLWKRIGYGICMEKDPGEEFFKGSNKYGFDFYSAFLFVNKLKFINSLVIGDYSLSFGQGVVLSNTFAFNKTADVLKLYRSSTFLRPSKSVNEANYMRGLATTVSLRKTQMVLFYSNKKVDGNVPAENDDFFTSLNISGYHRTASEMQRKHRIREQHFGLHAERSFDNLKLGFTASHLNYDKEKIKPVDLYNTFDFSGDQLTMLGLNYTYSKHNYLFFGESGYDFNGIASMNAMLVNIGSSVQAAFMYRYYDKKYVPLKANAFHANSSVRNEKGLYVALSFRPARYWSLSVYMDQYSFPWLKYGLDRASQGSEYFIAISRAGRNHTQINFRLKYKKNEKNLSNNETVTNPIFSQNRLNLRWNIDYRISKNLKARTRFEYVLYEMNEKYEGSMLYQDLQFTTRNKKIKLSTRYGLFHTDNYHARIYTYENDIRYAFSIPSFYGKGIRYYLLLNYNPVNSFKLYMRLAQSLYFDRETIGSGLTEINGNRKTSFKILLIYDF